MPLQSLIRPLVGIGVIATCPSIGEECVLLSQRLSDDSHGKGCYQLPGGHLEFGETFELCAQRELQEETNLRCHSFELIYVTNTIFSAEEGGPKHYITLFLRGEVIDPTELQWMEKEKNSEWIWIKWSDLKEKKLFGPLHQAVHDEQFHPFQPSAVGHFYSNQIDR